MSATPIADLVIRIKADPSSYSATLQKLGSDVGSISAPAQNAASSLAMTDRAAEKFLQGLKDQAATIGMTKTELASYRAEQLGVTTQAAGFIDQLKHAEEGMEGLGLGTQVARRELIVMGHEALQGNWKQFAGSFMVLAEHSNLGAVALSGLGAAAAASAVALATVAAAAITGAHESEELAKSLVLTGNAAGVTESSFAVMARTIADGTGKSMGTAREALQALVSTGQFTGSALTLAGEDVVKFSELSGESLDKVAADYAKMPEGVTKWAQEHNQQLNYMNEADYERIKTLEEAGQTEQALMENLSLLHAHFAEVAEEKLGYVEQAWRSVKGAISDTWDALKNIGREQTPEQQLQSIADKRKRSDSGGITSSWENPDNVYTAQDDADAEALQMQAEKNAAASYAKSQADAEQKAAIAAASSLDNALHSFDKAYAKKQELDQTKAKFINLYKGNPDSALLKGVNVSGSDESGWSVSGGSYDQLVADINKRYTDKGSTSHADETSNREVANLKAEIAAKQQQLALLDQYGTSQDKISDGDKKVLQIEQQLGLAQKDRIGKVTNAQLQEQLGYAKQLSAVEKEIDAKTRAAQAQKDYNAQVDKWTASAQSEQAALDQDLALYGTEGEARKMMATQLQYEAQARDTIAKAQRDGHPLSEQQQKDLMSEADARAKVVGSLQAQRDAVAAATQLQQENEKFAANSILDEKDRAAAILAIDSKKWQDLIANAGEGTEAQKKLIEQYDQWYADQENKPVIDQWKKTVSQIDSDFHDGFLQMLTNGKSGWESFTKSLKNTFEATVVDALYNAFAKKWVIEVVADIAGITGGEGVKNALLGNNNSSGTSITQLFQSGSSIAKLLDYNTQASQIASASSAVQGALGGASGMVSDIGGEVGSETSNVSSLLGVGSNLYGFSGSGISPAGATGLGASITNGLSNLTGISQGTIQSAGAALGSAVTGYAVGSITSSLLNLGGQSATGAKVGGTVGGVAGMYFGGPIGSAIGSVAGSILGDLVGSIFGSHGETRYGATYDITPDHSTVANLGGPSGGDTSEKTSTGTTVSDAALATYTQIQALASAYGGSVNGLGDYRAGYEVSPKKGNSWVQTGFGDDVTRTDLSGVKDSDTVMADFKLALEQSVIEGLKSAKLDAPYQSYLSSVGDTSKLTEDDISTIESTLASMKTFFDGVKTLGASFANLKDAGTSAQYAIAQLAGGLDNFDSELTYYSQNFTSTSEQYASQAQQVTDQLAALGESGVTTKDQFKAVVESIDLTTDAGQQLYQAMLALAPSFEQMVENAAAVQQAAQQAADDQQALWDNYFGAVYDSSQQLAMAQKQMQAKFDALGVAMPKTNAEFEALVENMDTSTQPMKDLQNALLALAPSFAQMTSAADQAQEAAQQAQQENLQSALQAVQTAYDNQTQAIQTTIDSLQQFIKTITDFKNSLALGDLSTLSPEQKYLEAKRQFETTQAAAAGGDTDAQGQLTQAAQDFLNASRDYNASNTAYAADYDEVQKALDDNVSSAQQQLSVAQEQLDAANQMVQGILDLNQTAMTLEQAVTAYFAAGGTNSATASDGGNAYGGSTGSNMNRAQVEATAVNGLIPYSDTNPYGPMGGYTVAEWQASNAAGVSDATKAAMGMTIGPDGKYGWYSVDGSHANGLDYVPFDGYIAELHKGERVLTAAEAAEASAPRATSTASVQTPDWSQYGRANGSLVSAMQAMQGELRQLRQSQQQGVVAQLEQSAKQHTEAQTTREKTRKVLNNVDTNTK